VFKFRDTINQCGRYTTEIKKIKIKDFIKFHGRFCNGMVQGETAFRVSSDRLFADGTIDRTDLRAYLAFADAWAAQLFVPGTKP